MRSKGGEESMLRYHQLSHCFITKIRMKIPIMNKNNDLKFTVVDCLYFKRLSVHKLYDSLT